MAKTLYSKQRSLKERMAASFAFCSSCNRFEVYFITKAQNDAWDSSSKGAAHLWNHSPNTSDNAKSGLDAPENKSKREVIVLLLISTLPPLKMGDISAAGTLSVAWDQNSCQVLSIWNKKQTSNRGHELKM